MNLRELTPHQRRVFDLLVVGNTNSQIAHALGCTEKTVKGHMTQIFQVTGCKNSRYLIAHYYLTLPAQVEEAV